MALNKKQLIEAIFQEMERVWGREGFAARPEQYKWLEARCQISREEKVRWQLIVEYEFDELSALDLANDETMDFLDDTFAVVMVLESLLPKYQSTNAVYPPRK